MAIQSKLELERYQFGVDIRKTRHIYGKNDKVISFGEWIKQRKERCTIVEMISDAGKREALFYQELNGHAHIIRTFGSIDNDSNYIIYAQEYAQNNDLHSFLYDTPLSQIVLIEMFSQVANAMQFIASKSMVHGDLGCRNVLVFKLDKNQPKNNLVKITDFGLARTLKTPSPFGNPSIIPKRYCALEILRNNNQSSYTEKSDVYSMGILMWEALSNSEIPYSYIADEDRVVKVKLDNEKLKRPHICNQQLWSLMEACWEHERELRPNFEDIIYRLSTITPSEVPDDQISILKYEPPTGYAFKLNVDVEKNAAIGGTFRKIYQAKWILQRKEPIVLIEMNEAPSKYEVSLFKLVDNHRHLINTFGFVENNSGSIMLLQECTPHGHLQELLSRQFEPSPAVLVAIFLQIIDAMIYIIGKDMTHGDLCCSNVLVFHMDASKPKENFVKLSNFALARPNKSSSFDDRRSVIPVRYCALEILRSVGRLNYSELSDVYSMGVLMWEACSQGKYPFTSTMSDREIRQKKLNGEILPRPWNCDRQIWPIIKKCWENEPQSRDRFRDMQVKLSSIDLESQFKYELGIDVKMKNRLCGEPGKIFYDSEWIAEKRQPIILISITTETAEREASFYIELSSHKHIVRTFGLVKNDPRSAMLIQERAPHGTFLKLLQSQEFKPSTKALVRIFSQIIDAMTYITKQDVIHGDLRCANVLVFRKNPLEADGNEVKLTNFSLTCTNDTSFKNNRQTSISSRYAAPEIGESGGQSDYSEFSDVYSMGILMWQACSQGAIPYESSTSDEDIQQRKLKGENLPMPKNCDTRIWKIITDCWYREPQLRYDFNGMMIRLSSIKFEPSEIYQYRLDMNVKKKNPLNRHGGRFYEADWIPEREPPIILMIMNKETAERQASWYFMLNTHDHIIKTFGFVQNNDQLPMLLQERATHGNLEELLHSRRFQPKPKVLIAIFLQILDAMVYIANQGIIIGNLCCSNVLVFRMHPSNPSENLVKLTEFNTACKKESPRTDYKPQSMPVRYCAPEILKVEDSSNYSEAADVYSFGVLMWQACSQGIIPYGSDTSDEDVRRRRLSDEQLCKPNGCDDQIWAVIEYCLFRSSEVRDNIKQIQLKISKINLVKPEAPPHQNSRQPRRSRERSCPRRALGPSQSFSPPSIWDRLCSCLPCFGSK
ncbi:unnamed protein product [Rotaria socialis]|uniref:Protein kinase domain-containing protein n=1 Tax=Rotaria socialis TaxID=392032 RepID=A0A821G8D8_9BILA|nr:unnamed protein product [Rotaria socialis]CAF4663515.1 unnamed protein product [Rotaria socialis]